MSSSGLMPLKRYEADLKKSGYLKFTPEEKEIIFAEKVVREIEEKKAQGIGVFTVDGKMIDIAFYDGAKRTLAMAKAAGVYKGEC